MVSFHRSNAAVMATLLASFSLATTNAAYSRGSRPSTVLGSRMLFPARSRGRRPSPFSPDIQRVMNGFDEMFDSMIGDVDETFYDPFRQWQRMSRPIYLLQGAPASSNALTATSRAKNAFGITQDEKQVRIVVDLPGAKASDIKLHLEENSRLLRISSETSREEGGISVHSRFDRAFTLNQGIDANSISAEIEDGVLTITAPKFEEAKEKVRRIDIVEHENMESGAVADKDVEVDGVEVNDSSSLEKMASVADKGGEVVDSSSHENEKDDGQKTMPEVEETVIDLDSAEE
eukprot:CAMPEP_0181088212 /NCGR_PEP_ID=MMETSP1071-20121207/6667_1 /TAXON_ID=35127 /ORGANISM="Thalassiosira sp., Strain NH16" /LENGTH=289 /DNA_ID=CAMNT_0023170115 /DNA_START=319 /DNA_END=1188 /DNA_ORIENTATION=-